MSFIFKISNWNQLKQYIDSQTITKTKGDMFEQVVQYYLLLNPIYKTKIKNIWLLKDVPLWVREAINLPNQDEGIDLIAITKDNEFWTIQCKYRQDENSSIRREDIATFLDVSHNICKNISHKIVCTTANKQSYKFEKLYEDDITFLLLDIWNSLEEDFFFQVRSFLKKENLCLNPLKPKIHQERAIQNAYEHYILNEKVRGKLIMACGSGKSLTAYWIAKTINAKKVLVAVPSLALIKQMLEVWTRESIANNIDINWIAVCSDDTVSKTEDDIFSASTKDLGIDVSTDIGYIANWLKKPSHKITIVFTTYQSGRIIAEASKKAHFVYDLGIMDEAHKTAGIKDSLFSHLLFDKNIDINKRLFMTATERRYRGESDEIISMDNLEIYGEDFEVLTFKEALESKPPILCDYKIIAMMVTKKEVASLIEGNKFVRPDNENYTQEVESEMLASTIALHKAIKKYGIKHTISFHSSIERAKFFQVQEKVFRKSFSKYTDLDTFHVSGNTPIALRNRTLETFSQSENSLITNARCLTEGVDVPNIDCVLFADPRQSTIDIVQAVGRALRLAKDKEFGYILVPILIDDENIDIDDIENKSFQAIITILRALASSDERIIDYFNTTNEAEVSSGRDLVDFNIPMGLSIDINEFNNAIKLSIISKIKKLKWRSFEESREFVRNLNLSSGSEWNLYCKNELKDKESKPLDIPSSPNTIYRLSGWNGMKDWLGTSGDLKYLPFEEAREFARGLGFKTTKEWQIYCIGKNKKYDIKPNNIPRSPEQVYRRNGWKNYKDWLRGTGIRSFEEARKFAITLNLTHRDEWQKYCIGELLDLIKKPDDIPRDPDLRYRTEWINWNDWLTGKKGRAQCEYRSFEEARKFVRSLGLTGSKEWKIYCKGELDNYESLPDDIPTGPDNFYKNKGWQGYGNWVGNGRKRRKVNDEIDNTWKSYKEAKAFVHKLGLKNTEEWRKYINGEFSNLQLKPDDIPNSAEFVYRHKGWISWSDWLGNGKNGRTKVKNALPFEEAKEFVRTLRLKKYVDWQKYTKGELVGYEAMPLNIPKSPYKVYKNDGWIDWADWLGY